MFIWELPGTTQYINSRTVFRAWISLNVARDESFLAAARQDLASMLRPGHCLWRWTHGLGPEISVLKSQTSWFQLRFFGIVGAVPLT